MNPLVIGIIVIAVLAVFFLVSNNRNQPTTTLMPMRLPTTQSKTVRQLLEEKCPLSGSVRRDDGVLLINPGSVASREDYLFSGCKAAGTCDTTNIDPISKTLLDNIPYDSYHKRKCHCGCAVFGEYEWDYKNNKWMKSKTVRQVLEEKCPLSGSEKRADGVVVISPGNQVTRDDYLFSGCKEAGTCDTSYYDPISLNIVSNIPNNCHCGCTDLGNYRWWNGKWEKKI
jgi:hypothetical protein